MSRVLWLSLGIGAGVLGASAMLVRRARAGRLAGGDDRGGADGDPDGAGMSFAGLWARSTVERSAASAASAVPPAPAAPPASGWVWPIPPYVDGRPPRISDGWGSARAGGARRHRGVDLMYRRGAPGELAGDFVPGTPNGTRHYFMPEGTPALAARAGVVTLARRSPRGFEIVIRHDPSWRTYYQHLERPLVRIGEHVDAGTPIGIVGASPLDPEGVKHLHFELWRGGASPSAIDPAPLLAGWPVLTRSSGSRSADHGADARAVESFGSHATRADDGRYSRAIAPRSTQERKS